MKYKGSMYNDFVAELFAEGVTIESEVNTLDGKVRRLKTKEGKEWDIYYRQNTVVKIVRIYKDGTRREV